MIGEWRDASALVSGVHQDEFEEVYAGAVDPGDAIMVHRRSVRARVPDPHQDGLLLLALPGDLGQRFRVGPGHYRFPAEHWPEVHRAAESHGIRTSVVPSLLHRLELRHGGALAALRAALLRRAPTFGPTYPRIAAE